MRRSTAQTDAREGESVTNAQDDPSWAQLRPHPENASPPPYMDPPRQQQPSAPAANEWHPEFEAEFFTFQDPSLPPGVIDISAELRWRHAEKIVPRKRMDRSHQPGTTDADLQPWIQTKAAEFYRYSTLLRVLETTESLHYPEGVINVIPTITSKHGGTTTEVFI